ncbi:MAG: transposase [Bacteriovoracaceae bacterium]|jgi:transposase
MKLPRFIKNVIPGYEVTDFKEWLQKDLIEIYIQKKDKLAPCKCSRCGHELTVKRGKHRMNIKHMPFGKMECSLIFWREKRHCPNCKKARTEALDFLAPETPHLSKDYSWWLGRLVEIGTVSRTAKLTENSANTLWRIDFDRLLRMVQNYKIPDVERISVDEVYTRRKKYFKTESRNEQYFTIITDLKTRRVIWVSTSRNKAALDEFFKIIGEERCKKIKVVAMDLHDAYKASVKEYCENATVVWDKFHVVRIFENKLNDERLKIYQDKETAGNLKSKINGKFKYLFLKRASKRKKSEQKQLKDVMKENKDFYKLELIKEKFLTFFYQKTADDAQDLIVEIKNWIYEEGFDFLKSWVDNFILSWETMKNYFEYRVTSALSEGTNNVIKSLKRRSFGFRNMDYFKLKIMQVCGYLNSDFISIEEY